MKRISKFLVLIICVFMLTTIAAPLPKASADENWTLQVVTDGSNLNVRSGPGTSYSIVGKFANGTYVSFGYMDPISSADWTYVSGIGTDGKRLSGYCNNAYLVDVD